MGRKIILQLRFGSCSEKSKNHLSIPRSFILGYLGSLFYATNAFNSHSDPNGTSTLISNVKDQCLKLHPNHYSMLTCSVTRLIVNTYACFALVFSKGELQWSPTKEMENSWFLCHTKQLVPQFMIFALYSQDWLHDHTMLCLYCR